MSGRLTVRMWGSEVVEPYSLSFAYPYLGIETQLSRGKDAYSGAASGTFQWTSAVKGLVKLLLVLAKSRAEVGYGIDCWVDGQEGLSLQYAIERCPEWLVSLFGRDRNGRPLAKRLFRAGSGSRRRDEPVTVYANAVWWSEIGVAIYAQEQEVTDASQLQLLIDSLERMQEPGTLGRSGAPSANALFDQLSPAYHDEVTRSLATTDIFTQQGLGVLSRTLTESPIFRRYAGCGVRRLSRIRNEMSPSERLGCFDFRADEFLDESHPLSIVVPGGNFAGTAAIAAHLAQITKGGVQVSVRGAHSAEIVSELRKGNLSGSPELVVLAAGPSAELLSSRNHDYEPLMFLPRDSQRMIESEANVTYRRKRYALLSSTPSNPLLFAEELHSQRAINLHRDSVGSMEPDETIAFLRNESNSATRALLFFPHYEVNRLFNRCRIVPGYSAAAFANPPTILWAHRRMLENRSLTSAVETLIRASWLALRANATLRRRTVHSLLRQRDYRDRQIRISGMHLL